MNRDLLNRRAFLSKGLLAGASAITVPSALVAAELGNVPKAVPGPVCVGNPVIGTINAVPMGNGVQLTISGTDLGNDVGSTCLSAQSMQGVVVPGQVSSVSPTQIEGFLENIPPGFGDARIMLAQGIGTSAPPSVVPAGYSSTQNFLSWRTDGSLPMVASDPISIPNINSRSPSRRAEKMTTTYHSGNVDPATGDVFIDLTSSGPDCEDGSTIKLINDMLLSDGTLLRFDVQAGLMVAAGTIGLQFCVSDYCTFIRDNVLAQTAGRLVLLCSVDTMPPIPGQIRLLLGGVIDTVNNLTLRFVSGSLWMSITKP